MGFRTWDVHALGFRNLGFRNMCLHSPIGKSKEIMRKSKGNHRISQLRLHLLLTIGYFFVDYELDIGLDLLINTLG